ncbi:diacylglycerol lipase-beta-like isoform X1 [Homalodisca vitripennis]|uniref:diacylglycerol lipase-beta-like isoform X1 n=1 Tax=Homalodisca vitripennis TaxID=197043 RepID=UPI001EEA6F04|nr:diacylglycerol lipase-beta-like isoform X1 [Homalodisca vitripennis]
MPALKLFGRKWLAATDDMVFPCLFEFIVRLIWLIMMGVITHRYYDYTFTCTSGGECVRVYLVGMLVLLSLNIVLLVALINRSAQGGICDVHSARRMVPPLLGAKLLLLLPEAGWNGLGTVWAFTSVITCPDDHFTNTAIDVLVCLDWVLFALLVFALAMVIDPIGSVKLRASQPDLTLDTLKNRQVTRTWIRRFRWFFCWLNRDKESLEAFAQVAGLFSSLFRDSDLVPSDLIAGCVLLRVKQKRESREQWRLEIMAEQRLKYKSDLREVFRGKPVWLSFDKAEHYMKLSMATYGCTFVMYRYCCTGICRLLRHTTCCACFRPKKVMVEGDNCCMCNMAGFKELADMTEDEIIYANFKNRIFEVPFCIISDHKTKSIVLTLRGSISLRDVFTDLVACPEKIDLEGLPEGSMAHKGMLITAKKLKTHLDETKTLDKALSLYPHYDLVITGHSLGAAAAVLLGILYKPIYPELKVYAFSTPCVITRAAAIYCESFVFTIGVGDDFAMRISVETIENLRAQLFEALQNCRLPKYRVIVNGFGYALFGVPSKHLNTTWRDDRPTPHHSVLLPAPNAVPYMFAPSTANSIEVFSSSLRQNCKETDPNYSKNKVQEIPHFWKTREVATRKYTNVSLYPAGNILHIVHKKKSKEEKSRWHCLQLSCCKKKRRADEKTYEMRWLSPDSFDELRVMPRMLLDHLPENVYKVLTTILDEQETEIEDNVEFIM